MRGHFGAPLPLTPAPGLTFCDASVHTVIHASEVHRQSCAADPPSEDDGQKPSVSKHLRCAMRPWQMLNFTERCIQLPVRSRVAVYYADLISADYKNLKHLSDVRLPALKRRCVLYKVGRLYVHHYAVDGLPLLHARKPEGVFWNIRKLWDSVSESESSSCYDERCASMH